MLLLLTEVSVRGCFEPGVAYHNEHRWRNWSLNNQKTEIDRKHIGYFSIAVLNSTTTNQLWEERVYLSYIPQLQRFGGSESRKLKARTETEAATMGLSLHSFLHSFVPP